MAFNALFDPKKKVAVERALEKGDLAPIFRKKTEPERLSPDQGESPGKKIGKVPGTESGLLMLCVDPAMFEIGKNTYSANELLVLSIMYNDLETAAAAIEGGADANHLFTRFPAPPPGCADDYAGISPFPKESVLQFAHGLRRLEIEFLLIAKGAVG